MNYKMLNTGNYYHCHSTIKLTPSLARQLILAQWEKFYDTDYELQSKLLPVHRISIAPFLTSMCIWLLQLCVCVFVFVSFLLFFSFCFVLFCFSTYLVAKKSEIIQHILIMKKQKHLLNLVNQANLKVARFIIILTRLVEL